MNTTFVSTSIPYVNADPHVGFALELVLADVITRVESLRGNETFLLTGTDENALKNVRSAEQAGLTPQALCDRNAEVFKRLSDELLILNDNFIRTSSTAHHLGASKFWELCRKGDIFPHRYKGIYCVGCEGFYEEEELDEDRCPIHSTKPEVVEETNYFFRLSAYQRELEDLISSGRLRIFPQARKNEALEFVRRGLKDFSISRPCERSGGWGVPVPGDPSQVLYVWFDALTNYLTGIGFGRNDEDFERFWNDQSCKIHVIGKDILRFHAIYWPAMLLSAGLPLPDKLVVHGFLTVDGEKISKSSHNAVDPFPIIDQYGPDPLRYFLLRAIPSGADGDFSLTRFREVYSSELANGIGNLVRRLETLCERARIKVTPGRGSSPSTDVAYYADRFLYHKCLEILQGGVTDLNRKIESVRPWDLLKEGRISALRGHLTRWVDSIRSVGEGLAPFLPGTGQEIKERFSGPEIRQGAVLFPRVN